MAKSTFVQALFHSRVSNSLPKLLASMSEQDLAPARLADGVNAFAGNFRVGLRSALLRELELGGALGNNVCVELNVGLMAYPIDIVVDNDSNTDADTLVENIVQKLGDKVRTCLPLHVICSHTFRLQRGGTL